MLVGKKQTVGLQFFPIPDCWSRAYLEGLSIQTKQEEGFQPLTH
jgi:hypothetical protein